MFLYNPNDEIICSLHIILFLFFLKKYLIPPGEPKSGFYARNRSKVDKISFKKNPS